jgi:hypothetical protein
MTHRPRDLALPEVVDGRSQAVGRDVERRKRDRHVNRRGVPTPIGELSC